MVDLSLQNVLNLKKNTAETEMMLLNFLTSKWKLLHGEVESLNRIYHSYLLELDAPFLKTADRERKNSLSCVLQEIDRQRALKQRQIQEIHFQINRQTRLLSELRQEVTAIEKVLNKQKKSPFFSISIDKLLFSDNQAFCGGIRLF